MGLVTVGFNTCLVPWHLGFGKNRWANLFRSYGAILAKDGDNDTAISWLLKSVSLYPLELGCVAGVEQPDPERATCTVSLSLFSESHEQRLTIPPS